MKHPDTPSNSVVTVVTGLAFMLILSMAACGSLEVRPVDIYPEDMCAHCRMAVSDERFACEVVTQSGEALKFDDIGCMEEYLRVKPGTVAIAETFYKDYANKGWVRAAMATIVKTDVMTPMGSGKVAFADPKSAAEFQRVHVADGDK